MIYDCFTFYNEVELLELRLKLLYNIVDFFVIVEADKTHRGEDKEFNFLRNKKKFAKYNKKIKYIQVYDSPRCSGNGDWSIENFQRNCIMRALNECDPEDIIIISDVDEIPNPSVLKNIFLQEVFLLKKSRIKNTIRQILRYCTTKPTWLIKKHFFSDMINKTGIACEQKLFYYYINCQSEMRWYGSVIVKYKLLTTPQDIRNARELIPYMKNAGWHFSYLGGVNRIQLKLNSIIDSDPNIIQKMDRYSLNEDYILACISNGVDIYGRKEFKYKFIKQEDVGINAIDEFVCCYPELYKDIK